MNVSSNLEILLSQIYYISIGSKASVCFLGNIFYIKTCWIFHGKRKGFSLSLGTTKVRYQIRRDV